MYELTSGMFCTTLLAPLPVFVVPMPVEALLVVALVAELVAWLEPVFIEDAAVVDDFALFSPRDDVLILLVVIAVFELVDAVPLLTAFVELKREREREREREMREKLVI
jgi:hypothetical protein